MFLSTQPFTKIGLIILTILLVLFIISYFLVKKLYGFVFYRRYDKTYLHFFTNEDFEGLEVEPIEFKTNYNNTLRGYIYSYKNDEYKGLAVVSHGLGVGHLQYTCEIEHFAKLGFKVIAFDNTGCARSDGKQINGLPQGIVDLKSCLEFIKTRDDLKNYKRFLFGHSWGGYSSLNVLPFTNEEDNIQCVVTMGAPYNSSDIFSEMLISTSKIFKFTRGFIAKIEKDFFGELAKMNTLATLSNTNYDTLLVHGTKDHIVGYESNFKFVMDRLNRENVEFITVENKRHRPNISDTATAYDELIGKEINELKKRKASKEELKEYHDNIDYHKLVEFDNEVMDKIDSFILKHFN